jgi:hypothetical protein
MKKPFLPVFILFISFLFYSCKKPNTVSSLAPTISQWLFKNTNYVGVYTSFNDTILDAIDSIGDEVSINFGKVPTAQSVFVVNDGMVTDTSGCYINVSIINGGGLYRSTNVQGQQVNVTVIQGKITASFANITVENFNNVIAAISGTLIQQ